MSEAVTNETPSREDADDSARRALLVADGDANVDSLREKIARAGFEVERATVEDAVRRVEEFAPEIILLAFGGRDGESRLVTLARRLRSEPATFALPVVFLFRADERTLRSAARHVGADDYFAQDAPSEELRARLEALLWRAEAGRRSAPSVADQRSEIDNFLFLLDSVASDVQRGTSGALALVETQGDGDAAREGTRERSLVIAHGFLKINLRRVDAVAFYGPATLLVYLPGADESAARFTLARLREEFLEASLGEDLFVGVSSFPAHGTEVERLVEQAEAALALARAENSAARVVVYGVEGARDVHASDTGQRKMRAAVNESSVGGVASHGMSARAPVLSRTVGRIRRLMLVVSDSARMAQVNLLLRSEGFEVRAAFDGEHALNLLRIDRPDLLVVDYELQGMSGVEMLRRLAKQTGSAQAPPALVLLPAVRDELRKEVMEAGARAVINLPYDPVELLDALRDFGETE
jgi:DNA-binding response OmpR family regulator